jgi:hypothetical protein
MPFINIVTFQGFWSVLNTKQHPHWLFVFGDNDVEKGCGGQAIIRGQPNAFGIPTKKLPSLKEKAFYSDDEYDQNKAKIIKRIKLLYRTLKQGQYSTLVLPEAGLGTGLAELNTRAPKTFSYLCRKLELLKKKVALIIV